MEFSVFRTGANRPTYTLVHWDVRQAVITLCCAIVDNPDWVGIDTDRFVARLADTVITVAPSIPAGPGSDAFFSTVGQSFLLSMPIGEYGTSVFDARYGLEKAIGSVQHGN
jgi:hypothetical protein